MLAWLVAGAAWAQTVAPAPAQSPATHGAAKATKPAKAAAKAAARKIAGDQGGRAQDTRGGAAPRCRHAQAGASENPCFQRKDVGQGGAHRKAGGEARGAGETGAAGRTKGRSRTCICRALSSLRSDEVNMRAVPAGRFPILWVYRRRELPVKIEREFDVWRLVEDMDGIKGWMHQATLAGKRTLVITGTEERTLRAEANDSAEPVAILKPGVVGRLRSCDAGADWCQVEAGGYRGWLQRSGVLGHQPGRGRWRRNRRLQSHAAPPNCRRGGRPTWTRANRGINMTLSMYQASVPVFARMFANLSAILAKAEADAAARKIDPAVLLGARLAPDMHPLTRQVQIASDAAKGGVARLAGIDIPSFPDDEASFAELQARITKTVDFIKGVTPAQIDGSETKTITLQFPGREVSFPGQVFLLNFSLPNFYFHVTMTYAILRHNGLALGKMDFIGGA
ncbi:MAG: DUF1993 family protein [Rhodospirillales bacterium]